METSATSSAHTPGFWEAYECHEDPDRYAGPRLGKRYFIGAFTSREEPRASRTICLLDPLRESEANARLIAAAPSMLQAGQALYDEIQRHLFGKQDSELPAELTDAFDRFEATWNAARGVNGEE
jgi:hypothetical protein